MLAAWMTEAAGPMVNVTIGASSSLPAFWQYLQIAGVVSLGLVGAAIAWGQYKNAAVKLQLDLLPRREAIFEAVQNLIRQIHSNGDASNSEIAEFSQAVAKADYLFGSTVISFINRLRRDAARLHARNAVANGHPGTDRAQKAADDAFEILTKLDGIYDRAKDVFWPYMRLDVHMLREPWHRQARKLIRNLRQRFSAVHIERGD